MTKRRREILTAIESINEWFETSDPITHAAESAEGSTDWSLTNDTFPDLVTTNGWEVVESGPDPSTELRVEAFQVVPGYGQVAADVGLAADVAASSLLQTTHYTQLAAVPGSGPATEGSLEGQDTGYQPGTEEGDTSEIIGPSTESERERERVISAFWRLLSDAGYDTW